MKVWAHVTLAELRALDDGSVLAGEWIGEMAARWAARRAAASQTGSDGAAWLNGKPARAVACDATVISTDRVARDKPFYSGKHKRHGMNLQVIASPDGEVLWVSGALPGSVHDKRAEWIWGVLDELEKAGLVTLADKGYQGSTCFGSRRHSGQVGIIAESA